MLFRSIGLSLHGGPVQHFSDYCENQRAGHNIILAHEMPLVSVYLQATKWFGGDDSVPLSGDISLYVTHFVDKTYEAVEELAQEFNLELYEPNKPQ